MDIKGEFRPQHAAPVTHFLSLRAERGLRALWTIAVLVALGLVSYTVITSQVAIGSKSCSVPINNMDRNQDGVISVSEPGTYLISAFSAVRKTLHTDQKFEPVLAFMEIKPGQCFALSSVILGGLIATAALWSIAAILSTAVLVSVSAFAGVRTGSGALNFVAPGVLVPKGLMVSLKPALLFGVAMTLADLLLIAQIKEPKQSLPPKGSVTIKATPRAPKTAPETPPQQPDTQKSTSIEESKPVGKASSEPQADVKGLSEARQKCAASGLTAGSEPFGKCVVQELLYSPSAAEITPEQAARAAKGK